MKDGAKEEMNSLLEDFFNQTPEDKAIEELMKEIDVANALRDEFTKLNELYNISQDTAVLSLYEDLNKRSLAFEEETNYFETLKYFYGNISRTYLHLFNIDNAIKYAIAYLKVNSNPLDKKGVMEAYKLLADIHIIIGKNDISVYCYEMAVELENNKYNQDTLKLIRASVKEYDKTTCKEHMSILIEKVKLPKTYIYASGEATKEQFDKEKKERILKKLMKKGGMSRATALNYWNYAQNHKEE